MRAVAKKIVSLRMIVFACKMPGVRLSVKDTQGITRNVYVGEMCHGDEVLQYKNTHYMALLI